MVNHKDWDINEEPKGFTEGGKPIIGVTLQNGLNTKVNGHFVPCDMSIEDVADGVTYLRAKRGRWGELRFGDSGHPNSFLVKIKNKDLKGVSFKYTGADGNAMTTNNGKPLCHFDNGISIESTPTYNGVRMDIIVEDPLTAPTEYPISIKDYGQKYVFVEENGGAVLRGEDQESIFIKPPYAIDANGGIGQVSIQYTGIVNNLITFKKIVDETWLRQAAAPVRIDPNVTIDDDSGIFEDANISSFAGQADYNWGGQLFNQHYNGLLNTSNNAAYYADVSAYSGLGYTVTLAKYTFNCVLRSGATFTMTVNPILRPWGEGTKTGATAAAGDITGNSSEHGTQLWTGVNCTGSGTDYDATAAASFSSPAATGVFDVVLTNASLQAKIDGTNNGDIFRVPLTNTAAYFRVDSSESAGTKPLLYFEYTEGDAGGGGGLFFFGTDE